MWFVRISKIARYENPYTIKGSIKQTGSKELPKSICMDRGHWNVVSVEYGELIF